MSGTEGALRTVLVCALALGVGCSVDPPAPADPTPAVEQEPAAPAGPPEAGADMAAYVAAAPQDPEEFAEWVVQHTIQAYNDAGAICRGETDAEALRVGLNRHVDRYGALLLEVSRRREGMQPAAQATFDEVMRNRSGRVALSTQSAASAVRAAAGQHPDDRDLFQLTTLVHGMVGWWQLSTMRASERIRERFELEP